MAAIRYVRGNALDLDAAIALYRASTLGARRPVDDRDRMATMLREANLVITAWAADALVGIARSMTDFAYACYLSDLAVHADWQRRGIGVGLIAETRAALHPRATIILLAAPAAIDYYPRIGFTRHESAWVLPGDATFPLTAAPTSTRFA
jgi:GNAT superfamily N-acetyltransferase